MPHVKPLDLGGHGPFVHLAPANGFPPATYRQLARDLAQGYHVVSLLPRPLCPGSRPESAPDWHPLADDLIRGLDGLGLSGIVGLGHSIGGVLTLWAAIERPDLFRAVILVDPVIFPPSMLRLMRAGGALHLARRIPLVRAALHRRRLFPDRQACFDHYRGKPLFDRWSDSGLWDYVDAGTHLRPDGQLELLYPPEWEAHIFATTPTAVWRGVSRLRLPALLVRGEHSPTFLPAAQERLLRLLPRAQSVTIRDAGHLVPMERPHDVASAILEFLERI
jgi:pimeloyl-ACP methyl ester carboxylesterase